MCRIEILVGMFGQVKFNFGDKVRPLIIPGDAVVSRAAVRQVAVVAEGGVVHFRKIVPGRDFGSTMKIHDGLREGEFVIENPTDEIREAARVQVRTRKAAILKGARNRLAGGARFRYA